MRDDLGGALGEKADLLKALKARQGELDDARERIAQLLNELRALRVDLGDREGAVSRLDSRVAELESELAETRLDLQSEGARLAAYRDALHQARAAPFLAPFVII